MADKGVACDIDAGFEVLGPLGRYALVQLSVQFIVMWSACHQAFSLVFTGQTNKFRCKSDGFNISGSNGSYVSFLPFGESCSASLANVSLNSSDVFTENYEVSCSAMDVEYENPKNSSFISEFDLVCDREFLFGLTQTFISLGNICGAAIFPYLTDRYGRKPTLVFCTIAAAGSALGLASSVNYPMFAVFKFLVGLFIQGMEGACALAMLEYLITRHRARGYGCAASVNWTLGMLTMVPISYLLRNNSWKHIEYAFAAFFVHLFLSVFVMDETLRWLVANDRYEKVKMTIRKASKWNSKIFETVLNALYSKTPKDHDTGNDQKVEVVTVDVTVSGKKPSNADSGDLPFNVVNGHSKRNGEVTKIETEAPAERLTPWHLFSHPRLRYHTLYCAFAWFINSLTYFGLILMSSTLSGSLYLSYTINAIAEIPQAIFLFFFFDRLGRRKSFALFSVIAGLSLLASALAQSRVPDQSALITALSVAGKIGISGSFNVIYTYTAELFPTNIRNTGLGVSYVGARLGGMLAPYSEMLYKRVVYAPGLIFGVGSLLVSIGAYFLPETTDIQLPQTLAEMDVLWSGKKKITRGT